MINKFQKLASPSFVKSKLNVNNLKFSKLYSTIVKGNHYYLKFHNS